MDDFFRIIEEKIADSGYKETVIGEDIYNCICDEMEYKENGSYLFMSKESEDTFFEYKVDIFEEDFNLSYIKINQNGTEFFVDFD